MFNIDNEKSTEDNNMHKISSKSYYRKDGSLSNKITNFLFMLFIILSLIVCAYSLFCAITIFSDNQYKLSQSVDQLYDIIAESVTNSSDITDTETDEGDLLNEENKKDFEEIDNIKILIGYIENINKLGKESSSNDILSFLYIFITTIFVGGGAYILKQLSNSSSNLTALLEEQKDTIIVNQNKIDAQEESIKNNQDKIDKQEQKINANKENIEKQTVLNEKNKKVIDEYGMNLLGRLAVDKIKNYANSGLNSILMLEILYHTGKPNLEIVSSTYLPDLTENVRLLSAVLKDCGRNNDIGLLPDDLDFISRSVDKIIEMSASMKDTIKPFERIYNESKNIYDVITKMKNID